RPRGERRPDAEQSPAVPARPRRRRLLPDRDLQLAAPLRPLPRSRCGVRAQELRHLGAHRGPGPQPGARLHPAAAVGRITVPGGPGSTQLTRSLRAGRINLPALEASLRRVQRDFAGINERLGAHRDPLDDAVIGNMMAGYAMVDALVADGVDLFALGNSKLLLELNTLVLCGTS